MASTSSIELTTSDFTQFTTSGSTYANDTSVRQFLLAASRHGEDISEVYRETLRSMINIFSNLFYLDSEEKLMKILCHHANPERTVAKLKQESNIILPIITVSQTITENDDNRRRNSPTIVHEKVWNRDKQRAERVISLVPRPVNILYQAHIWTKYKADMDQIAEQIRRIFNPSIEVLTSFNSLTKAFLTEEEDNTALEVPDREERVIKKAFNIAVETYVPGPRFLYTSTGEIEAFNAELYLPEN